jgi:hypothetical protein
VKALGLVARAEEARRWENDDGGKLSHLGHGCVHIREQQRGEGARDRVSPIIHNSLGRVEKRRGGRREARARGKGEGARRSCKKTTSAKCRTRGERW